MSLFGKKVESVVEKRPDGLDRLPAGQYLTKKWPVLSYGRHQSNCQRIGNLRSRDW